MQREPVPCLGVDGGASGVRAVAVGRREDGRLSALTARASRVYPAHGRFQPVPIDVQRAELAHGGPDLGADERAAGEERVSCAASAIAEAARQLGAVTCRVGVCMPGLKTADGRGVAVLRNGPRMPSFCADLERALARSGVAFAAPLPPLASDGLCGGLGERHAAGGGLADLQDALYLGGGTGLAEAALVRGRVVALDELGGAFPKAWAMAFEPGVTYEDALSMGGWNRTWAAAAGLCEPLGADERPEEAALRGDVRACALLARSARALAQLCDERRARMRERTGLDPERVVVGQQLGALLARADLRPLLLEPALAALCARGFADGFLRVSTLRDAPALGAAALALGVEG